MADSKRRRPSKAVGLAAGTTGARAVSQEGQKRQFGAQPQPAEMTKKPVAQPKQDKQSAASQPSTQNSAEPQDTGEGDYTEIPARLIRSWRLKDRSLNELEDDPEFDILVKEIGDEGIISPITVRKLKNPDAEGHHYEEVVGFKRLAAAKIHDIPVPAHVRVLSDLEAIRLQKSENSGRSKPSVWSLAKHFEALLNEGLADSQTELAAKIGVDRSQFANYIRIARNMPEDIEKSLKLHCLGFNSLNAILALIGDKHGTTKEEVVDRIVEVADDINARPEKASNILSKVQSLLNAAPAASSSSSIGGVYRSQKGKAFSVKPGSNKLSVTLHSGALEVATEEEITEAISNFLEKKGLTLEKVEGKGKK